jgi:hypothetical protein
LSPLICAADESSVGVASRVSSVHGCKEVFYRSVFYPAAGRIDLRRRRAATVAAPRTERVMKTLVYAIAGAVLASTAAVADPGINWARIGPAAPAVSTRPAQLPASETMSLRRPRAPSQDQSEGPARARAPSAHPADTFWKN